MSKPPRCGAPNAPGTNDRYKSEFCRRHVAVEGTKCYAHRDRDEPAPADRHE